MSSHAVDIATHAAQDLDENLDLKAQLVSCEKT